MIWPWPWSQGHTKCCPVPSTSCDLCTCKLWNCYVQWFRRRFIYKKIHYLTLGYLTLTPRSRSHEVLPSTLNIMWPMHGQNLKMLLPKHYEEMHFQENTLFDLWSWPWGQGHTKCRPVPLTSCDLCTGKIWSCYFEKFMRRCIYKKIHYLTFDTRNVTQYPLHHVIYAPTKFEVPTSNSLGEDTITRNVTDGQTDRQTDGQTDGRRTDFGTKLIYPIFLTKKLV